MILVLGLLLMTVISPFSALAMLMIVLVVSAVFWTISTLLQTLIRGNASEKG